MVRKIAKTNAEELGIFADRVSVVGMIEGKWGWALGVYSRIEGITISEALETAIKQFLEGKGIPWKKYETKREALLKKTPVKETEASLETEENLSPLVPGEPGGSEVTPPPALAPETAGEGGGGKTPRKPLADVMAEIGGRPMAKRKKGAA